MPDLTAPVDPQFRLAALQALAQGGTAARQQLDQTKAQMDAAKTQAVGSALKAAADYGLPSAAGQELSTTISRPYDTAAVGLAAKLGARATSFDKLADPTAKMFDTRAAANIAKASRGSGNGGGGGGGGGGSAKAPKAKDWWNDSSLPDQYDTKENFYSSIYDSASNQRSGKPAYQTARELAIKQGVPAGAAQAQFKPPKALPLWEQGIQPYIKQGVTQQQFQQALRSKGVQDGLSLADRDYLAAQYQAALQAKKKKR